MKTKLIQDIEIRYTLSNKGWVGEVKKTKNGYQNSKQQEELKDDE